MENTFGAKLTKKSDLNIFLEKEDNIMVNLTNANIQEEYVVKKIETDEETASFLFTLGCYEGQTITVVSVNGGNYIVAIKDARYSIDKELASCILI